MSSEDILSKPVPVADVFVKYGDDDNQHADLRVTLEHSPSPLVLMIHGGFWRAKYDLVHAGHLCAALTHAGVATLNIEYRRVGNAGGGWPGSFKDVSSAFQAISELVKKYQLDVSRTVVIGHSAGGQLALALAARQLSLRGAVALAPVSNLRRAYDLHLSNDAVVGFLGGTPSQVPDRYREASPIELSVKVPQVIIHGTHDDTVPVEMSRSYVEAKRKRDEDVHLIELDCGHFELIDPSSNAWPMVERAVLDLLKP
jgi:acetyl esterase/lipase